MIKYYLSLFLTFFILNAFAQEKVPPNNYPSLLWEIRTSDGGRPSYLFGTMHVSNKMVFNLSDSFYLGIRNADVVALETNPESWQADMQDFDMDRYMLYSYRMGGYGPDLPQDYLFKSGFSFEPYEKKLERALFANPSTINNLLYRSMDGASDFEEDTYLDMYIYQVGKKWGKKVTGVERYAESMRLMMEAYGDAAKDKNKRTRQYDIDEELSASNLQEAYRKGNLDLLDSINRVNSVSEAFDEKFLYRRNEIQANSIDSIIKTGASLFVGVGAAHLPGNRGVVDLLRAKGYRLRPIFMNERASDFQQRIDSLTVPVKFQRFTEKDSLFSVELPGTFYPSENEPGIIRQQFADMANGSYYMVTRVQTHALQFGDQPDKLMKKIDSVLYENIPGKILEKSKIELDGFPGYAILNKTRRGDYQRYAIYVTPYEVLVFKMSAVGDYVQKGKEADQFFSSIQLRKPEAAQVFKPSFGGFEVWFPSTPQSQIGDAAEFQSYDEESKTSYLVLRRDIHNFRFISEDSFDLSLMEESFSSSDFIDKQLSKSVGSRGGYPYLDAKYRAKGGDFISTRFLIQGPHYYMLMTRSKKQSRSMNRFFESFSIRPFEYKKPELHRDSALQYSVSSPVFPIMDSKIPMAATLAAMNIADDESEKIIAPIYKSRVINDDSTGERIWLVYFKSGPYTVRPDEEKSPRKMLQFGDNDSTFIIRSFDSVKSATGTWYNFTLTDTASSRMLSGKARHNEGTTYFLLSASDTISGMSPFVQSFFSSFQPADSQQVYNMNENKTERFFRDYEGSDSVMRNTALANLYSLDVDSSYAPKFEKAIEKLSWNDKNYLLLKKKFIAKLSEFSQPSVSHYLGKMYKQAGDTLQLQYSVLNALLNQATDSSYAVFGRIMSEDPPIYGVTESTLSPGDYSDYQVSMSSEFFGNIEDSLELAHKILPELLTLANVQDYRVDLQELIVEMAADSLATAKELKSLYDSWLLEARLAWKKQVAAEMNIEIRKQEAARDKDAEDEDDLELPYVSRKNEPSNDKLIRYMELLMPFYQDEEEVRQLFNQVLNSSNQTVSFDMMKLMLRHKHPVSDSLINAFAEKDEYRYSLYRRLLKTGGLMKFPKKWSDPVLLGISKLKDNASYYEPVDTVVYLDKIKTRYLGEEGYVYFYKYKRAKTDLSWKIATVGLLPLKGMNFEFDENLAAEKQTRDMDAFTELSSEKIEEDKTLRPQLEKYLRRLTITLHPSGKAFYADESRVSSRSFMD